MKVRLRLDQLLVTRGLASSREEAQRRILAGDVIVGEHRVDKPGKTVDATSPIRLKGRPDRFVSRAGQKLEGALVAFGLDVGGRSALDSGLSTGGFTDCLLQRGAARVIGVDVGYGQTAEKIRTDPRVHVMERTNLRHLVPGQLPWRPDLATIDVSFISLTLVLDAVKALLIAPADVVALVKPQFEVGRERIGKGGIVRDPAAHRLALETVMTAARKVGFVLRGAVRSSIEGTDGNREFLLHLATAGEDVDVDLDTLVGDGPAQGS